MARPEPRRKKILFVDFRTQHADIRQVPILFGIVKAVTDDELIRNREAEIIHMQRHAAALRLIQQRGDMQRGRAAAEQILLEERERHAGIDDILDDQHVPCR